MPNISFHQQCTSKTELFAHLNSSILCIIISHIICLNIPKMNLVHFFFKIGVCV